MKQKNICILLIVLAAIGFVDSLYLTLVGPKFQYLGNLCSDACGDESLTILGIHVARYGIFYYLSLIIFSVSLFRFAKYIAYPVFISFVGVLFSLYFLYHQIFIINGYCIFCLISLTVTVVYFATVLWLYKRTAAK